MAEEYSAQQRSDHDLLVRISTLVEVMGRNFTDFQTNMSARVEILSQNKLDKVEAQRMMQEALSNSEKVHNNHDKRIKDNEDALEKVLIAQVQLSTQIKTWGTVGIIVLGLLQFIIGIALK